MNIVQSALKHRRVTLTLTLILILIGVYSLMNMPRREDPKLTIRQGLVIMVYPGAKALQMEEQVTKKVEALLFRYDEVKKGKTESTTTDGKMIVQVELQDWVIDKDKFWSKARHDLLELKHRGLPKGVIGPIINSDFGDTVALLISVSSARHGYTRLEDFLEIIEDELRPLPEVSKLKRYGGQREQIYVTTDSQKMAQYGVSEAQVMGLLRAMNTIAYSGEAESRHSLIPVHTTGLYQTVDKIKQQIVDISPEGGMVRLGDVADVQRRYEEPTAFIRVNGEKVLMLSVEMQPGYNIVDFGKRVDERLGAAERRIPPDVTVKKIIDQPQVVETDIFHFLTEFLIAILAVIAVTMILLPLRVAVAAALAIPITIMITFGCLDLLDINLQQMTLAGLILVLGMVVDNAIVVVDDYIDRLDHGTTPWEAAVRSATELFIPVFSATLAIIFAFIPLNFILTGIAAEFVHTLPISVTVALLVSLVVAALLVPLLCYFFIKRGLHSPDKGKKSFSLLDPIQRGYDRLLAKAFQRPWVPLAVGGLAVAGTLLVASQVEVRMFPLVERNQFCLEVYMDKGSRIEATDRAVKKLERLLAKDPRVKDVAAFVGMGSPRFYTTYAPQFPDENFAQLLITTTTPEAADHMVAELIPRLDGYLPDGGILVRQLQNGPPVDAPIEVRVTGNDLTEIKRVGARVAEILKKTPGANFVRTTFEQDYYGIEVKVDDEVANRLGLTSQGIATALAAGLKGAPVSTLWEGDNPIEILLRLEQDNRDELTDLRDIYLTSPVTGGRVPLRQVAKLVPEWQTGRIRRRNGVRTLTVRGEAQLGRLPNDILGEIRPRIEALKLPKRVSITFGGELEDQIRTLGQQTASLLTSLVLIFMVLLFQFKGILKALIIMLGIPLSWFGAFLGLYLTGNAFCFTAFLGVISLCGLVVRNGIILVEYADKLQAADPTLDVREVAMEAGKRRMRPVFLTAMAAAVGVVPMIIGGSELWAPLGAVLSVGLIGGMLLTLLIMPVLYYLAMKPRPGLQRLFRRRRAETAEA